MHLNKFQITAVVGLTLIATASPAVAQDKHTTNQLQTAQMPHRNVTYSDLHEALAGLDKVRGLLQRADRNTYGYQGHGEALDKALRETNAAFRDVDLAIKSAHQK